MTMTFKMFIILTLFVAVVSAHQMSLSDYTSSRTLRWVHGVNTWPSLMENMRAVDQESTAALIEGDVTLLRSDQWRPMMLAVNDNSTTRRRHTGVTFKDWLHTVAHTKKALKINMVNSGVVKPALKEMYAAKDEITSPVIIHADIWRGTNDNDKRVAVKGDRFVREVARHFPTATVSVGSTTSIDGDGITWRQLFDRLADMVDVQQPVMMVVDAQVAQHSVDQLLWYLGIRQSLTLLIRSHKDEHITKWLQLVRLREQSSREQIVFDLFHDHEEMLEKLAERYGDKLVEGASLWRREGWRVVSFLPSTKKLSGIVTGAYGPAFLGDPHSFLLSERAVFGAGRPQVVSGRVHFVPKDNLYTVNAMKRSGLAIYLKDSVASVPSAEIHGGILVFIGYTGLLSIENGQFEWDTLNALNGASLQKSVSTALPQHACYSFTIDDSNTHVTLNVRAVACRGELQIPFVQYEASISLRTPRRATQRHVLVKKLGEPLVDLWVDGLSHSSSVRVTESIVILLFSLMISAKIC